MTTVMIETDLPGPRRAGETDVWVLPRDGEPPLRVEARFLGVGTSQRDRHTGHPVPGHVANGERCSACRWFEPRIFRRVDEDARYLVLHTGRSVVPGEVSRFRLEELGGPLEVIETLVTRRRGSAYLSVPAGQVLAMAAQYDRELRDAYTDRAVE